MHFGKNYNYYDVISLPDNTRIFNFYGATIFLLKIMSACGWVFLRWIYSALFAFIINCLSSTVYANIITSYLIIQ
jgi:hypothetical protein